MVVAYKIPPRWTTRFCISFFLLAALKSRGLHQHREKNFPRLDFLSIIIVIQKLIVIGNCLGGDSTGGWKTLFDDECNASSISRIFIVVQWSGQCNYFLWEYVTSAAGGRHDGESKACLQGVDQQQDKCALYPIWYYRRKGFNTHPAPCQSASVPPYWQAGSS